MISSRLCLLLWVFFIHLAGIYLFTKGFLLTRLSLPDIATCSESNCGLSPTHSRAILLIIDALRFDFVSPNPPTTLSPFHHNIFTLPRELNAAKPSHSLIFNSYADPPTVTLQRIKGIVTGALPTFVDVGNNFGGSSIAEDSLVKQLKMAGKKLAFMGDDTWMSVFPDSFAPNMTFPFDSFNVEDLHTVDEGVIKHLFPLLEDPSKPFDFLIGHFLGVDHVGHRVGPDHPSMKAKLQQMNNVLTRVVEKMDEDTLLVVLGDHGMDRFGDHGGDDILETSSAMWIYSKGPPLTDSSSKIPSDLLNFRVFPGTNTPHRSIQQIDLLPSLSLLLGVPIPYNNLGTVIPELFWRGGNSKSLEKALQLNVEQVMTYLTTYRSSPSGGELDEAWDRIQAASNLARDTALSSQEKLVTLSNFTRVALSACRAMWAQFNSLLMAMGLFLISTGLCASWSIYSGLSNAHENWKSWLLDRLPVAGISAAGGAILGFVVQLCFSAFMPGINIFDSILFLAGLASSMAMIILSPPKITLQSLQSAPILLILHSIAFFSNSFTFWEDRIVPFLLVTSIVPYALTGLRAQEKRLRNRILSFSLLFAVCVRLISISTICREEQQPYCHVTFYASSSLPSPPLPVLYLVLPASAILSYIIKRFLHITMSDKGVSRAFLRHILTPTLVSGSLFWILEWIDSSTILGEEWSNILRVSRTFIARMVFCWSMLGGVLWHLVPVCLDFLVSNEGENRQVKILGFANTFGSPYLIFWTILLSLVYVCTQLTGQLILVLLTIALISFLEVLDSVRDTKTLEVVFSNSNSSPLSPLDAANLLSVSSQIQFADIVPIALLGLHAFYATGHQSTISSMQWKSAFILTPYASYSLSILTVFLNTLGPIFLMALAAPLAALWNRAPLSIKERPDPHVQVKGESTLAALGVMIYYSALLLGASVSAAVLRRHLMVWKVFAPRFIASVLELLVVDLAVLIGVGFGFERISGKVEKVFRGKLG